MDQLPLGMDGVTAQMPTGLDQGQLQSGVIHVGISGALLSTSQGLRPQVLGLAGAALKPTLHTVNPGIQALGQFVQRTQFLDRCRPQRCGRGPHGRHGNVQGVHTRNFRCKNWRKLRSH